MGIFVFIMFIGFVFLVALALIVTGITLVVLGSEDKKKGGKGTGHAHGLVFQRFPDLQLAPASVNGRADSDDRIATD